jgi:hypothetical protein
MEMLLAKMPQPQRSWAWCLLDEAAEGAILTSEGEGEGRLGGMWLAMPSPGSGGSERTMCRVVAWDWDECCERANMGWTLLGEMLRETLVAEEDEAGPPGPPGPREDEAGPPGF